MNMLISIIIIVGILLPVAFFTLAERKIMGSIQRRYGPNVVGVFGILQPFADGLKLLFSEVFIPKRSSRFLYFIGPFLVFLTSFINWAFISFSYDDVLCDLNYSLIYVYLIMSFGVYGIILAGWVSGSRYSFIGSIRSLAQMVSYEAPLGVIFLIIILISQSVNIIDIIDYQAQTVWFIGPIFPLIFVSIVSFLAENNRAPFDLPEAEAELVAGYNLEYSSIPFALFFLGEYANMMISSGLFTLFFLAGWIPIYESWQKILGVSVELIFFLKMSLVWFLMIFARASYPRYRFDHLLRIGWYILVPVAFLIYLWCINFVVSTV